MSEPKSIKLGKYRVTQLPGARTLYVHDETILEMSLSQMRSLKERPLTDAELMVLMFEEVIRLRELVPMTEAEVYGQIADNYRRDRNKADQTETCADGCQLAKDYGFDPSEGHSCAHSCAYETRPLDDAMRSFIEGMSVSVDVSTGEHDATHRYMGTVTEVMDDPHDKHGVTLLVQDAEPNFDLPAPAGLQHDKLRDNIGQAIKDVLCEWTDCFTDVCSVNPHDSRNIDEIADAVMVVLQRAGVTLPVTKEEPFAWYIDGPQGSCSTVYKQHAIEPTITWLASKDGFERDDYTVTALYLGAKP